MRIAVVGAGIVGVTTAFELASDGHEVAVFERQGSVAAETSFANAGLVAPGYVTPWAAPGMPAKVLRHLLSRHAPVRMHASLNPATLAWIWKWWRACRLRTYQANRRRMQRLAYYSRDRLHAVRIERIEAVVGAHAVDTGDRARAVAGILAGATGATGAVAAGATLLGLLARSNVCAFHRARHDPTHEQEPERSVPFPHRARSVQPADHAAAQARHRLARRCNVARNYFGRSGTTWMNSSLSCFGDTLVGQSVIGS